MTERGQRHRWEVVAAYAAVAGANQLLWLTFTPLTTPAAHHYHVSVQAIGWLSEVFPLLYVVLAVPAGAALDRWFRPSLATGAVLTALGATVRMVGPGFAAVLAGQVVVAVAQPLVLNAVTKLAGSYLPESQRPQGIAVGSAGLFVGMVVALVLGATLGGGHIPLLVALGAALSLAAAAGLCFGLLRPGDWETASAGGRGLAGALNGLRTVWGDGAYRLLVGMVVIGFGVFIALATWLQALLGRNGIGADEAGYLLVAMVVAGVVGAATLPAPVLNRGAHRAMIGVSVLAAAGGCVVLALVHVVVVDAVVLAVMGLLLLTNLPIILELAERGAGELGGTATAGLWLAGNGGGIVVALIIQALLGDPTTAFVVLGAISLLGLPLVWRLQLDPARVPAV